jgi:hypothetical protein
MRRRSALSLVVLIAVCGNGCGNQLQMKSELLKFGSAYHTLSAKKGKAPSGLEELQEKRGSFPTLYQQIQDGQFVVIWNAKFPGRGEENDKYILAFPKSAAEKGGLVLRGGGSWKEMTAEEFKATPKLESQGEQP